MSENPFDGNAKCPRCNSRFRKRDVIPSGALYPVVSREDRLVRCPQCGHYLSVKAIIEGKYPSVPFFRIIDPLEKAAPSYFADALTRGGIEHLAAKEFNPAMNDFDEAIRICPNYVPAFVAKASLHQELGSYAEAEKEASNAIHLGLQSSETLEITTAHLIRAWSRLEQGKNDDSLADFDRVIALNKKSPMGYFNRAAAHRKLSHWDAAAADYRSALDLNLPYEQIEKAREGLNFVLQYTECTEADRERDSKYRQIGDLTEELIRIGHKARPDNYESSYFMSKARARAWEIGVSLNDLGGMNLMMGVFEDVISQLGKTPAKELSIAWRGAGKWGRHDFDQ